MTRTAPLFLMWAVFGCSIGNRSTVSDTTPPGLYELVNTSSNKPLATLEIPPGQQVGMEYGSSLRAPDAAVVVSDSGPGSEGLRVVWRQELPKRGHYKWRFVSPS